MLDATQTIVKNKLGLTGQQVYAYKVIYDFICKFSFCQFDGNNIYSIDNQIHDIKIEHNGIRNHIPVKTYQIIKKIGTHNLGLYFSPHAYPSKFKSFCKKMRSEKAQITDYYTPGLLIVDKLVVEESYYEEPA